MSYSQFGINLAFKGHTDKNFFEGVQKTFGYNAMSLNQIFEIVSKVKTGVNESAYIAKITLRLQKSVEVIASVQSCLELDHSVSFT